MVYAHRADIYDADTHMMEPPTWLAEFADAKLRPHLTPFGQSKPAAIEKAEQALSGFAKRQQNPDLAAEIEASFMAMKHKGFQGLGPLSNTQAQALSGPMGAHLGFQTQLDR